MKSYDIVKTIILEKGNIDRDFQKSLEEQLLKRIDKKNNFIFFNTMKKYLVLAVIAVLLLGGGYLMYSSQEKTDSNPMEVITDDDPQDNVGIANPASTYCIEQGGELKIENEVGNCYFDDGSMCEEWTFFRGECQKGDSK